MPIGPLGDYPAEHWEQVKKILTLAMDSSVAPSFSTRLVSEANETAIIHRTIVQNVAHMDVVICDVSGLNPNVMFELGLRLASGGCAVIVKDEKTKFTFDAHPIEHLEYESSLGWQSVEKFKQDLVKKVRDTYNAWLKDGSTFHKAFGPIGPPKGYQPLTTPTSVPILETLDHVLLTTLNIDRRVASIDKRLDGRPVRETPNRLDAADALQWLKRKVLAYATRMNIGNARTLMGDNEFFEHLLVEYDPPTHFQSPKDFRAALDTILEQLSGDREPSSVSGLA